MPTTSATTTAAQSRFGASGAKTAASRDAGGTVTSTEEAAPAKAGGAYNFLAPHPVGPPAGGDVVALDATTLNLAGGHYLKIAISVQLVQGKASATDFTTSKAAEATIDEFSDRTVASLSSNPARKRLTADLLTKLKAAYPGEVFDVFLTQFVTQ